MIFVHNDVVRKILTVKECIPVLEKAFRQIETGEAMERPRIDMYMPCDREDGYFRWGTMEGANDGFFAIRMKSDIVRWPEAESGARTEEKYCVAPGTWCGLVMLFSTHNGEPLAFLNDGEISRFRVGASAAIGAKHLAIEMHDFGEAILTGGKPEVDGYLGMTAVAAIHGAYESALAGRAVSMAEVLSRKVSAYQDEIDQALGIGDPVTA